jgi:hypothetical protein
VNQLLGRIFAQRRNSGGTDLEAIESALRVALHQAGASTLSELLQFEAPPPDQRQLPCACGHQARYQELRSRPVLTVVGWVRMNGFVAKFWMKPFRPVQVAIVNPVRRRGRTTQR